MGEERYTPWPSEPLPAKVLWLADLGVEADPNHAEGHLHFIDPDGRRASIPVTRGDHNAVTASSGGPVWGITVGDATAVTEPSVHFEGHWHSPYTTTWRLVDELPR